VDWEVWELKNTRGFIRRRRKFWTQSLLTDLLVDFTLLFKVFVNFVESCYFVFTLFLPKIKMLLIYLAGDMLISW